MSEIHEGAPGAEDQDPPKNYYKIVEIPDGLRETRTTLERIGVYFDTDEEAKVAIKGFWEHMGDDQYFGPADNWPDQLTGGLGDRTVLNPDFDDETSKATVIFKGNGMTLSKKAVSYLREKGFYTGDEE